MALISATILIPTFPARLAASQPAGLTSLTASAVAASACDSGLDSCAMALNFLVASTPLVGGPSEISATVTAGAKQE